MFRRLTLLAVILLAYGCGEFPKDSSATLKGVRNDTLYAGISHNIYFRQDSAFVNHFAKKLNATVVWTYGDHHYLMGLLENNALDLAIGGFTVDSPYEKEAALSRPYRIKRFKAGHPQKVTVKDIKGTRLRVTNKMMAAYVRKEGGIPVLTATLSDVLLPAIADEIELKEAGMYITDKELHKEEYVIAVKKGENAFLMEIEKFIHEQEAKNQ
jgi:polar amino acid transport system substrate-binding protein